jgi:hypothetical protein
LAARPRVRPALFDALHQLTLDLGARGACNYLLSNGDCLFAHCSTQLSYIIRQAPFAVAHLRDQDLSIDFSEVTTPDDRVAVIATVPLTDNERWTTMPNGSLWLFEEGCPVRHQLTVAGPGKSACLSNWTGQTGGALQASGFRSVFCAAEHALIAVSISAADIGVSSRPQG